MYSTVTQSAIEWTDHTWNPVTGCTKISPGCANCYAETMARRLRAMGGAGYERGFAVACHDARVVQPLLRKTPTFYFVNSMSDLFHPMVPFAFIDTVLHTMRQAPQHTYQVLTKRPERMAKYFSQRPVPDNTWLGVSVENKTHGVPRIDVLRGIKANVRFLSVEPLLEDIGTINLAGIHWVIVGGESGPKARPMHRRWALNIHAQCRRQRVPFFFKQWGTWGGDRIKRSKKDNGRMLAGRVWNQYPARPRHHPA